MIDTPQLEDAPSDVECEGRSFRVEYEPSPLATGWMLRERHHAGWPVLAGPFDTHDPAVGYIAELLEAGSLLCEQDEPGDRTCWV